MRFPNPKAEIKNKMQKYEGITIVFPNGYSEKQIIKWLNIHLNNKSEKKWRKYKANEEK